MVLFAALDHLFVRLANAMDRPELARDPRFDSAVGRRKNADLLEAEIERWIAARPAAEVLERLHAAQVPVSKVNSIADLFADPHITARENLVAVDDADGNPVRMVGVLPKLAVLDWSGTTWSVCIERDHDRRI